MLYLRKKVKYVNLQRYNAKNITSSIFYFVVSGNSVKIDKNYRDATELCRDFHYYDLLLEKSI